MALTFAQWKQRAEFMAQGQVSAAQYVTLDEIVNEAGRMLYDMHQWNWAIRAPTTLSFTADTNYISLPSDFGQVISLRGAEDEGIWLSATTIDDLAAHRSQSGTATGVYLYAIAWPTQAAVTSAPAAPRIELWPTPSATDADCLSLLYRSAWVELAAENSVANIPVRWEMLMHHLLRALVADYMESSGTSDRPHLAAVYESPVFTSLQAADGMVLPTAGPIRGGAVMAAGPHERLPWTSIADPS